MADGESLQGQGLPRRGVSSLQLNIEDYYLSPPEAAGCGLFIRFDHEFVGRAAREKMAAGRTASKVTLASTMSSLFDALYAMFDQGLRAKFIEFPSAVYSMHPFDRVTVDGKLVGLSTWVGYSANEGKMLTLAMLDERHATPGTEVTFVWGEPDGGTTKPAVERHKQVEIKAVGIAGAVLECGARHTRTVGATNPADQCSRR